MIACKQLVQPTVSGYVITAVNARLVTHGLESSLIPIAVCSYSHLQHRRPPPLPVSPRPAHLVIGAGVPSPSPAPVSAGASSAPASALLVSSSRAFEGAEGTDWVLVDAVEC